MSSLVIRPATLTDFAGIAGLVSDLGYPTSPSQMQRRLEAILADHDYQTLVACDGDHIVGFVGMRSGPLYEADGSYGQIMALAWPPVIIAVASAERCTPSCPEVA